ncbi:hypothetical protein [Kitasatospora viridis]|uniref:Uncharacterized protein n=1 Tax=Kitasatospora viridis TaxID=281105 RepID=A0A561UPR1_9ACTN|nr:hypothetical protein [Kitasatospora viridis]TWG01331.1 hypothetical protein FHX73_115223 [Kitasatospora viridis]
MSVDTVSDRRAGLTGYRELLIDELNRKLRRPSECGGTAELPLLLDELAWAESGERGVEWLVDELRRVDPLALLRKYDDAQGHVLASQYGEDAHRRGWLRLDRTLTAAEHDEVSTGRGPC